MNKQYDSIIEVTYDEPDNQEQYDEHCLYAVRQHKNGWLEVCIVGEEATRIIDDGEFVARDGSIYWELLDDQTYDRLFIETDVDDVDLQELNSKLVERRNQK